MAIIIDSILKLTEGGLFMKRLILILFTIVLLISFTSCNSNKISELKTQEQLEPSITDISLKTNSTDLEVISKQIMVKLFDEYKKDSVRKEVKVEAYTINKINVLEGNSDDFSFSIDYSLKPAYMSSYIVAGNGMIEDSWINHKFAFLEVEKIGDKYKIKSMGTGK